MKVSVVIPCLNESETLSKAIGLANDFLKSLDCAGEVVLADNGSTDDSREIAEGLGARVVRVPEKGYGNALKGGIAGAAGDIIVMGDADGTYDFREARVLVDLVRNGADLAMGSRLRGKIEKGAMPFLHRYLGTPVLTMLIRILFLVNISDCNCGMRAFSKSSYARMGVRSGGMEFASEMICRAARAKMKVAEHPISLARDIRNRQPHLHTWRDGWRHLKLILACWVGAY